MRYIGSAVERCETYELVRNMSALDLLRDAAVIEDTELLLVINLDELLATSAWA